MKVLDFFLTWLNFYRVKIKIELKIELKSDIHNRLRTYTRVEMEAEVHSEMPGLLWKLHIPLTMNKLQTCIQNVCPTSWSHGSLMTESQIYTFVGPINGQWKTFQQFIQHVVKQKFGFIKRVDKGWITTVKDLVVKQSKYDDEVEYQIKYSWLIGNLCKAWDVLHSKNIYPLGTLFIVLFKIIWILSAHLSNLNIFSLERLIILSPH